MNEEQTTVRPASLFLALRKGLRAGYDNLGYVVFVTFLGFVVTGALFSLAALVVRQIRPGAAGYALFVPALFAAFVVAVGAFYYASKSVYHEYPALSDTWVGIKRLIGPATALFFVDLLITLVLVSNVVFVSVVLGSDKAAMRDLLIVAASILCRFMLFVWLMLAMYHLPLLVAQLGMESGPKVLVILRKSFLLAMDNPGFTVGLFLAIIAFAVLCAIPALIGMAVLFLGAAAFVLTHALRELFIKYGIVEEEPEIPKDDGWNL